MWHMPPPITAAPLSKKKKKAKAIYYMYKNGREETKRKPQTSPYPFCMPALGSLDDFTPIIIMEKAMKKSVNANSSLYTAKYPTALLQTSVLSQRRGTCAEESDASQGMWYTFKSICPS